MIIENKSIINYITSFNIFYIINDEL